MRRRLYDEIWRFRALQRVNMSLARASATSALRDLKEDVPVSWEFSGFSQNREDGIIDYLVSRIQEPNRYFAEIGAADGIENNTAWLAIGKKYSGLMVEGSPRNARLAAFLYHGLNLGVKVVESFVTKETIKNLVGGLQTDHPDFLSLDIDGVDYHIMQEILFLGVRPRIVCVEYNSAFGPEASETVRYDAGFRMARSGDDYLTYGVSVQAWRDLFAHHSYSFVTTDTNGVNAFFIDQQSFDESWVRSLRGAAFHENYYQSARYVGGWEVQRPLLKQDLVIPVGVGHPT